jgi:hypothetical protein
MNTRYRCPSCQHKDKTFVRYIDIETGEHVHPSVGRCNRESNCGYHYTPKQYFQDNNISFDTPQPKAYKPKPIIPQPKPVSFIPVEMFKQSLQIERNISQVAETNHFVKFLINLFGVEVANELISRYFIATSKYWNGATVFWQIDTQGKVRTGKIMLYNPTTGKRVKNLELPVYWVHKTLKQPEFELRQCLFGEHLLIDKTKPVAIVESEKTAVIASVYLPQFLWVAVGSITNLNAEKCSVLKGRTVTLFPDLNGFNKWSNKAKELSHLAIFTVSDLLERKATETERKQGLDLADYLIMFNYKDFTLPEPEATAPPPVIQPLVELKQDILVEQKPIETIYYPNPSATIKQKNWDQDINELVTYFTGIILPEESIEICQGSTITDVTKFIDSHLAIVKLYNGKRTFLPYLNRLLDVKQHLTIKGYG